MIFNSSMVPYLYSGYCVLIPYECWFLSLYQINIYFMMMFLFWRPRISTSFLERVTDILKHLLIELRVRLVILNMDVRSLILLFPKQDHSLDTSMRSLTSNAFLSYFHACFCNSSWLSGIVIQERDLVRVSLSVAVQWLQSRHVHMFFVLKVFERFV